MTLTTKAGATCRKCGCTWRQWSDGSWSLLDGKQKPGQCCDNSPDFLDVLMYWTVPPDEPVAEGEKR